MFFLVMKILSAVCLALEFPFLWVSIDVLTSFQVVQIKFSTSLSTEAINNTAFIISPFESEFFGDFLLET